MPTEDQLESPEFRQHIRTLLYQYSKTHITTNFVTFTEDLVSELLQDLRPIPLTDPYSFVVPVDPFQTFSQIHSLSSLQAYDEILPTTKEAIACIKKLTGSKPGLPMTARVPAEWTESTYEPLPEPMYPALTRRSRKHTPQLGKKAKKAHRQTFRTLTEDHGFVASAIEPIAEEKLDVEDILKVKHQIAAEELDAVKSMLKGAADWMRNQPSYTNRYLDPNFLCNIDYHHMYYEAPPEEEFLPIFPRRHAYPPRAADVGCPSASETVIALKDYKDILPMIEKKIEVEDLDGSLPKQNLVLVDGWEAIQSSPPTSPSSQNSDGEDQTDQLFFESSPNTDPPPLVEEITKSRLDDVLIPRSRQIGGKSGVAPHILAGKTMETFLYPLLSCKGTNDLVPCLAEKKDGDEPYVSLPASISLSLLGQTGSEVDTAGSAVSAKEKDREELNNELEKLYSGHGLENMILQETLDEKQDMLMEVPSLPEPNVHPPNVEFQVPKSFAELLVPPTKKESASNQNSNTAKPEPQLQFLKKVRGKQSLNLALSWVTFTVDERLPSVPELVGVNELFTTSSVTEAAGKAIMASEIAKEHGFCYPDESWRTYSPPEVKEEFSVLLTRQERMRLARMEGRYEEIAEERSDEYESQYLENIGIRPKVGDDAKSLKRSSSVCHEEDSYQPKYIEKQNIYDTNDCDNHSLEEERPPKRRRRGRITIIHSDPESRQSTPESALEKDLSAFHYDDSGYHSPDYFGEEDKENYPPLSFSSSWPMPGQEQEHGQTFEEIWDDGVDVNVEYEYNQPHVTPGPITEIGGGNFDALSLDSKLPCDIDRNVQTSAISTYDTPRGQGEKLIFTIDKNTFIECGDRSTSASTFESASQLLLQSEPEIASHTLGISAFAALRARKFSNPKTSDLSRPIPSPQAQAVHLVPADSEGSRGVPRDLLDQNTIILSGPMTLSQPQSIHRYMTSIDFIQKRGLVRALQSSECTVELVERQTLGGVDIIVDPYCAVIFLSLFTLPARCEVYIQRVAEQSWKYTHLLVVFEAYPDSMAMRSKAPRDPSASESIPNVYTPPIIKAIKKFRRDISIADACGTKCPGTKVLYAFADRVEDAAAVTRVFGNQAEQRDETSGVIWGERAWLAVDFVEEEERLLAGVRGMNPFSAAIILCQISLEDFVELLPQERSERFCGLLSEEVINECNADIESRLQALQSSSDAMGMTAQN